jgi:UDP-glucose 4-epimerase
MSILVIGGTGFIGARVSKKLIDLGETVVAFDLMPNMEFLEGYESKIKTVRGDIMAIEDIMNAIKTNGITKIINLAYVLEIESMMNPHLAVKVNCLGTNNVFEAAKIMGVKRVLFASSITAYGPQAKHGDKALNEDDPLYPVTVYGKCKAFSEFMAKYYRDAFGMEIYVLRVGSAFGPGRTGGATAFVSNITTLPALGQPLLIPLKKTTNFVYSSVNDVAQAFVTVCQADAAHLKHGLYNIGGYTHRGDEVEAQIKELIPDAQITWGEIEVYYVYRLDNSRLTQDTGFTLTPMSQGIKDNINEVRQKRSLPLV